MFFIKSQLTNAFHLPEEIFISNNGICLGLVDVEEDETEDTGCPGASQVLRHQHRTVQCSGEAEVCLASGAK